MTEISPKITQEFNKYWKRVTADSGYLVPETISEIKQLGPFPYFQIKRLWIYPKEHTRESISHLALLMHKIVGDKLFSMQTVREAIRDEIKCYFSEGRCGSNELHLNNLIRSILSKNKNRCFVRFIHGLELKNIKEINGPGWRLFQFDEKETCNFVEMEAGDNEWKEHLQSYLKEKFEGKICLLVESEGDSDTAKSKAHMIATYIINTLRYFICIHLCGSGRSHYAGIRLDSSNQSEMFNAFSINLNNHKTTIFGYGERYRQKYPLTEETLEIIKRDWYAERLWSLIFKKEPTDLEASIVSSISWLGDAQQENDLNAAYVKYWVAIEALLTGHKKGRTSARLKATIPNMISQISKISPSKSEIDKAYELRSKVVHAGKNTIVSFHELNKVCAWATNCLSLCIHLSAMNYVSRLEIENKIMEKTGS